MIPTQPGDSVGAWASPLGCHPVPGCELKERLERQADRSIVLGFNEDPDILGGLILTVGDRILDASLRAQLGILKENIKRGE